jgi:chemotaxis methyl-accepting protein methylase
MGSTSTGAVWLQAAVDRMSQSRRLRRYLGRPYLRVLRWIWNRLPTSLRGSRLGRMYGVHVHRLIQLRSARRPYLGTFFFRNRPEMELLTRLLDPLRPGSTLDLTILGCSKGAEVYSFSYAVCCARPDLRIRLSALDIDPNVLQFAEEGVYSLQRQIPGRNSGREFPVPNRDLAAKTFGDQRTSVFERMTADEIEAMFDCECDHAMVKPRFRQGITWHLGDAGDAKLVDVFGLQDIVIANRFLCHMQPREAEVCLRNLARLVKPGGYLFVSGVDLAVRSKVAQELGWTPLTELIQEIHEGDPSLRRDWPLEYWGLEPFDRRRHDWEVRYASVFQIGVAVSANTARQDSCENTGELLLDRNH